MDKKFSGIYGLVLTLDLKTANKAKLLAREFGENKIKLNKTPSHITLYHSNFSELSLIDVKIILKKIAEKVRGIEIIFDKISQYEKVFYFWDVLKSCEGKKILQEVHEISLDLKKFFLKKGLQQTNKEGLKLSGMAENYVRNFGYQFCKELFLPHITLAVSDKIKFKYPKSYKHTATVKSVDFVKVGEWGTVEETILSLNL